MPWEDDEGEDAFSPLLPQEDRLWRHPAEVAAAERARAPLTTTSTIRTPWRQAFGLAAVGAAGGAIVMAGLFWSVGALGTNPSPQPVTQSFAMDPIVALPVVVDHDEWPSMVAEVSRPAVARVVVTQDTRVFDGSAVVFRNDGLLLTSHHLVVDADQIRVTLADGSRHQGTVVGTDPISGVAVVEIGETDLVTAHLAIIKPAPEVGQYTAVVTGIAAVEPPEQATITALGAQVDLEPDGSLHGMIQLGAPLPRGGDGAAVVDDSGAVIGIALDTGAQNATYAVPIGFARKIADDLVVYGEPRHSWMGIRGLDLSSETQIDNGLSHGVRVTSVLDGPAKDAGLERGDFLLQLDAEPIDSMTELISYLRTRPPGKTLDVQYLRDGEHRTSQITLALRPVDDGA